MNAIYETLWRTVVLGIVSLVIAAGAIFLFAGKSQSAVLAERLGGTFTIKDAPTSVRAVGEKLTIKDTSTSLRAVELSVRDTSGEICWRNYKGAEVRDHFFHWAKAEVAEIERTADGLWHKLDKVSWEKCLEVIYQSNLEAQKWRDEKNAHNVSVDLETGHCWPPSEPWCQRFKKKTKKVWSSGQR